MEYNPGTGFLTDDSGLVLSYHRRGDLRPVGRLLVTSPEQQSDAASLLVTGGHSVNGRGAHVSPRHSVSGAKMEKNKIPVEPPEAVSIPQVTFMF